MISEIFAIFINDLAIVAIKTDQDQESTKFDLDTRSDLKTHINLIVTDSFGCDKRGLSESQQCFKSKVKREDSKLKFKGTFLLKCIVSIDEKIQEKCLSIFNLIPGKAFIHPHAFTKVESLFSMTDVILLQ